MRHVGLSRRGHRPLDAVTPRDRLQVLARRRARALPTRPLARHLLVPRAKKKGGSADGWDDYDDYDDYGGEDDYDDYGGAGGGYPPPPRQLQQERR